MCTAHRAGRGLPSGKARPCQPALACWPLLMQLTLLAAPRSSSQRPCVQPSTLFAMQQQNDDQHGPLVPQDHCGAPSRGDA